MIGRNSNNFRTPNRSKKKSIRNIKSSGENASTLGIKTETTRTLVAPIVSVPAGQKISLVRDLSMPNMMVCQIDSPAAIADQINPFVAKHPPIILSANSNNNNENNFPKSSNFEFSHSATSPCLNQANQHQQPVIPQFSYPTSLLTLSSKQPPRPTQHSKISIWTKYKPGSQCGNGAYGTVFSAERISDGQFVAVKIMPKDSAELRTAAILRELMTFRCIKEYENGEFPFLLNLLEHESDNEYTYFILPLSYSDLTGYIQKSGHGLSVEKTKHFLLQILLAVNALSEMGLMHRDLKPSNIMIFESTDFGEYVKLIDFGLVRAEVFPQRPYSPTVQTVFYRAPEVFLQTPSESEEKFYDSSIDMWSIGCIFAEMINAKTLFDGSSDVEVLIDIIRTIGEPSKNDFKFEFITSKTMPDTSRLLSTRFGQYFAKNPYAEDLMKSMLMYNPDERIHARAAVRHSFFNSVKEPYQKWTGKCSLPF
ncbi:Cyclin-dependent kinase 3 [Physocladia obscura]|uniref:Cyclin-dependent kinase 3 n=1 Tax=Physocladia obscura TaxID=109957 RepID=A0AAD5TB80_9FUNG|nr:Cyclin-dependent kinase 3 [Physocladia obscura]